MIELHWIDIILIPGIFQGVFLALIFLSKRESFQDKNMALSAIISLSVLMLLGRLLWARYPENWPYLPALIPDTIIFLFGPYTLLYIRRLLLNDKGKLHFAHFLPAIIHLSCVAILMLLPRDFYLTLWKNGFMKWYLFTIEGSAVLLNLMYVLWVHRITKEHDLESKQKKYLLRFLLFLSACYVTWLLSFLNTYTFGIEIWFLSYDAVWVTIPLFIYFIGYTALKNSSIHMQSYTKDKPRKAMRLSQEETDSLKKKLHEVLEEKCIYLNADLTLVELSKYLDTSPNNASWLLNEVYEKTFYDFINSWRLKAFLKKIESNEHQNKTLFSLALEVGFKSKSTFNKVFKQELNSTPSTYINSQEYVASPMMTLTT